MRRDERGAGISAGTFSTQRDIAYTEGRSKEIAAHGTSGLFGWPSPLPTPPLFSLYWFSGSIELVGGALLALGLFSRCAAFVMSGEMAFAYFLGHAPKGFFPIPNRGDAAILFCFIFLYFVFAGPGPWSVDAKWRMRA